jgi:predicted peptidase
MDASRQSAKTFLGEVRYSRTYDYLEYLPDDYERGGEFPLVLFLHGSGERGDDLSKVRVHGPPMEVDNGRKFPFILISPQCPETEWWDVRGLAALVLELEANYRVDKQRIYLTGLSMGGFGSFGLAAMLPEKFAAIAVVCGGGEHHLAADLAKTPIYSVHGDADPVVNYKHCKALCSLVKKSGGEVSWHRIKDGGHGVWQDAYAGKKLYDWLLKHRR